MKAFILALAVPLAVGGISAFLTQDSMQVFSQLNQPLLSPPGWVFPIVWTALYILMGIASFLVCRSGQPKQKIQSALTVYGIQLAFNFLWPIFFFTFDKYWFSFFWLVLLWLFILKTYDKFSEISKPAAYLLIPYILWVTFAGYLNLSIAVLN